MNTDTINNNGQSWREIPTIQNLLFKFVDDEFARNVNLKDDGKNDFTEKLLHCAGALIADHDEQSFSAETFFHYCQPFEIPFDFKSEFFKRFVEMLIKNQRCKEIKGCYLESVYQLL